MGEGTGCAPIRLAELVAALSLGVDLGFGQPMNLAGLTAREVEVLVLLARGMSNKQIAERLVITPKTAGNHVEHIYAKIDASSRAAAALFAVQHGLLPEGKTIPGEPAH
jgi:DNA-binding NarL/FixJ family response regulator